MRAGDRPVRGPAGAARLKRACAFLACAAAATVAGCGAPPMTDYDPHPRLLRTKDMFRVETESIEEMLVDLRLKAAEPRKQKDAGALFASIQKTQEAWRQVASHFPRGLDEEPLTPTEESRRAHERWVASLNGVSTGLKEAVRQVGEDRMDGAAYSIWQAHRSLEDLWAQAGFSGVALSCIKFRCLAAAARWIPFERRQEIARELNRHLNAALARVIEQAMFRVTDKQEAADRMALLAQVRAASDSMREALAQDAGIDEVMARFDALSGSLDRLREQVAAARE